MSRFFFSVTLPSKLLGAAATAQIEGAAATAQIEGAAAELPMGISGTTAASAPPTGMDGSYVKISTYPTHTSPSPSTRPVQIPMAPPSSQAKVEELVTRFW
jgi:hypothetical protein